MYLAKYGLISMSGNVAKLAASHDFRSYVSNMAFLYATHKTSDEVQGKASGKTGQTKVSGVRQKKECCPV